jgi:hypothetical protein
LRKKIAGSLPQHVSCEFVVLSVKEEPIMDDTPDDKRTEARPPFTFGVSGHRDMVPESLSELRRHIATVFDRFRLAYPGASYELLSPLAEGADRAAAEVALNCGIKLVVPLPMPQPDYEQDFATPESLREFRRLLAAADSHFEVRGNETGSNLRADRYAAVGDYIARRSHVLILLWDGRENDKVGGTAWVKKRREDLVNVSKSAVNAPPFFGYAGTIHILTPRLANPRHSPIRIIGELPSVPDSQADERSRL